MKEFYDAIDEIKDILKKDLIGPVEPNEIVDDEPPIARYAMGILYPRRGNPDQLTLEDIEQDDNETIEDSEDDLDDTIKLSSTMKPSSMAISFVLPSRADCVDLTFSYGKYRMTEYEKAGKNHKRYTHVPVSFDMLLEFKERFARFVPEENCEIEICYSIRKVFANNNRLITVSIANRNLCMNSSEEQSQMALFGCELTLDSDIPFEPVYVANKTSDDVQAMLYRDISNYAYGHGTSIDYSINNGIVTQIKSTFMPTSVVKQMKPGEIKTTEILSLQYWQTADRNAACGKLESFINEYQQWKDNLSKQEMPKQFQELANESLHKIDICIKRLKSGVDVLRNNDNAWQAFVYMNEAMLLQRINTKRPKPQPETVKWYPFQLAYILQIIPDMVGKSEYRDIVDLLWFPTGGGKTEAYLGVAGFSIFYRELTKKKKSVSVIMRYTLRLLTIQQFERATALICSCEHLRKKYKISANEISIGLWIGSGMTPNNIKAAQDALVELHKVDGKPKGNPMQITTCPWCGSVIDLACYSIQDETLNISCSNNEKCEFHHHLPIYLVDEDIYTHTPTLLLSTIDKFARIVWHEKAYDLFGGGETSPDLVIQDELHLISGPLGSLTGVYEIAVDYLCEQGGNKPKVIASTATVKNAEEQIKNLYNKEMLTFPANGLSYNDSFFAIEADMAERPARTYIGLCETGGNIMDLFLRVYANQLFIKQLFRKQGKPEKVIDQFYTTVGYFNAIRDLGSSSSVIQDRMQTNYRSITKKKFKEEFKSYPSVVHDELTSRKSAREIKDTLRNLEKPFTERDCYSYILATNMLSVGIDINRLGLMTVYNQPKTNSEYIQATSRVGRSNPGLVLTLFNNMRSRDKSHYEQFKFYHQSFYQYVEPTSVTPFSARAIEKALHCVFIAMARHTLPHLAVNSGAADFDKNATGLSEIIDYIIRRVRDIYPKSVPDAEKYLNALIEEWDYLALHNASLVYKDWRGERQSLLNSTSKERLDSFPLVLHSLRNIDEVSNIYIEKEEHNG